MNISLLLDKVTIFKVYIYIFTEKYVYKIERSGVSWWTCYRAYLKQRIFSLI